MAVASNGGRASAERLGVKTLPQMPGRTGEKWRALVDRYPQITLRLGQLREYWAFLRWCTCPICYLASR